MTWRGQNQKSISYSYLLLQELLLQEGLNKKNSKLQVCSDYQSPPFLGYRDCIYISRARSFFAIVTLGHTSKPRHLLCANQRASPLAANCMIMPLNCPWQFSLEGTVFDCRTLESLSRWVLHFSRRTMGRREGEIKGEEVQEDSMSGRTWVL